MTALQFLDYLGVAVFAVSGALVASRKQLDLIGFGLLATLAGIGGGTTRDLLIGRPVFWVNEQSYLIVCLIVALLTYILGPKSNIAIASSSGPMLSASRPMVCSGRILR